ncbi:MAG: type IX secretion system membrane protein PorP/SprF [Elusimicrobiota bacterium]|nr:type IX secretion system membrane protein PorP/SprF [Elusimicrobiota bacterium]
MKNHMLTRVLRTLALAAVVTTPARAAFEEVGVGARATAMGGAVTAAGDDVYAIHYNPASLATLDRPEVGTTYSRLLTGLSDNSNLQNSFLGYARPLAGGRQGTAGFAWNYRTLDSLYRETSLYGSYGRALWAREKPDTWYGGASLKVLNRSLGGTSAAGNAVTNTGIVTNTPDPVLQSGSKTAFDLDLGVLWRVKPRWSAGMMIQHLLEPDVAFSGADSDRLGRNLKFGGAYKTPFSAISADLHFLKAPDGSTDKVFAAALEKWLPTLLHGAFGLRGSLAVGSRDVRRLGAGLAYRIGRMQVDYGFALPLGGVGSAASHRMGLTFRFGRARAAEAALSEALLENLSDMAAPNTETYRYQLENVAQYRRTAIEEFLRQARLDATDGRFADAADKLAQAAAFNPDSAPLAESRDRMKDVAGPVPQLKSYMSVPYEAVLYEAALHYAGGRDREALRKTAYAKALDAADGRAPALEAAITARTGLQPEALPGTVEASTETAASGTEKLAWALMSQMEEALQAKDHQRVLQLGAEVLRVDPENALAHRRIGAAHYALRQHAEALKALRTAYRLEKDPAQRESLKSYITALETIIDRSRVAPAAAPRPAAPVGPGEIERLYDAGVELYSQGRLKEAAGTFKRILELEPGNVSAKRALDRVQSEILQSGGR